MMEKEKADQTIGIRIPRNIGQRLEKLALRTGRSKTYYIREAIVEHLDDLEDVYLAEQVLERVRRGEESVSSLEDVERRLGLMSSRIKEAPTVYNGTLGELFDGWAKHVLLSPSVVEEFHRQFCTYLESADPLFLVRHVTGQRRGQTERTDYDLRLRPTDNSPAWWIHYQLFSDHFREYASFDSFIESVPCHMFQVRLPENINKAGWHVAHIFDVKDRDVQFRRWDRKELVRRFARNIHPCNYFYIPKVFKQVLVGYGNRHFSVTPSSKPPAPPPATQTRSSPAPAVRDCPARPAATDHTAHSHHQSVA